MPPDVVDLVLRADQCVIYQRDQSSAENPAVKKAMEALRCQDMRADLIWLQAQYASSELVGEALKRLDEHYLRVGGSLKPQ
jgi:hypothetical protein